jgi:hypothetical protein
MDAKTALTLIVGVLKQIRLTWPEMEKLQEAVKVLEQAIGEKDDDRQA